MATVARSLAYFPFYWNKCSLFWLCFAIDSVFSPLRCENLIDTWSICVLLVNNIFHKNLHSHFVELSVSAMCVSVSVRFFVRISLVAVGTMNIIIRSCDVFMWKSRSTKWCYRWSDNVTRVLAVILYIHRERDKAFGCDYFTVIPHYFFFQSFVFGYGTCKAI